MTILDSRNIPRFHDRTGDLRARLKERDPRLWTEDAEVAEAIRNRLGWLDASAFSRAHLGEITAFARAIRAEGFRHVVLLGMGGSSLAPEVLAKCFGAAPGCPDLTVLDSTAPDAVRAAAQQCPPAHTVYLVSSKSGTTAETLAFHDYFRSLVQQQSPGAPGKHFAVITDPGSPLVTQGDTHDFRAVFLNPADIGGRFSALSYFGLVPAAAIGIDVQRLLDSADTVDLSDASADHALEIGIALGELAKQDRNKMTLLPAPGLAPLGGWIEQLVAESTGKCGCGIVPIDGEGDLSPEQYGADRIFVGVGLGADPGLTTQLDMLATRGHPILHWQLPDLYGLGAEFMRWEIATAAAGATLGVNPFDEPDVNESKARTRTLLHAGLDPHDAGTDLSGPGSSRQISELCAQVAPGDYLSVLAFVPPSTAVVERLQALRAGLARRTGAATSLCLGPRYLHSSGQLHKGGVNQGVFLMLTADPAQDAEVPAAGYSFQQLIMAQALGDLSVLRQRGRRIMHIHLEDAASGIDSLAASVAT
jgi:glucose-6-phosphate isomerase